MVWKISSGNKSKRKIDIFTIFNSYNRYVYYMLISFIPIP
jgi:hypothetical protein